MASHLAQIVLYTRWSASTRKGEAAVRTKAIVGVAALLAVTAFGAFRIGEYLGEEAGRADASLRFDWLDSETNRADASA
jgi:hypothetical protein